MDRGTYNKLEKEYRVQLFTSLLGIRQPVLVGTQNRDGDTNLAIFNTLTHFGSNPPVIGLMFRPETVSRHTLQNIRDTGVFTINIVNSDMWDLAHATHQNYPKEVSEFDACGLTAAKAVVVNAPLVAECSLSLEVELREAHKINTNQTTLIIGEVVYLHIPDNVLEPSGLIRHDLANTVGIIGNAYYHTIAPVKNWLEANASTTIM